MWLCGLLVSGELFLWNRDKDLLKTTATVPEVVHVITAVQGTYSSCELERERIHAWVLGDFYSILTSTAHYVSQFQFLHVK